MEHVRTAQLSMNHILKLNQNRQCDLLDRYPEHRFVASQAQQFKWLEEQYPQLFDLIKSVG